MYYIPKNSLNTIKHEYYCKKSENPMSIFVRSALLQILDKIKFPLVWWLRKRLSTIVLKKKICLVKICSNFNEKLDKGVDNLVL